ncbi:lipoprotein [Streptomyces sp. P1-3]|uniref:lipoprotein n=1 Tax=Streptomyces sp. P1-3 TaxID=3421658 RepID=UPI003D36EF78
MQHMYDMRHFGRTRRAAAGAVVVAAVMLGALTGCSSSGDGDKGEGKSKDKGSSDTKAATSSSKQFGNKGSACVLPVTFDLAKSWKPKTVKPLPAEKDAGLGFNKLLKQGGLRMACEIDGKPAGHLGMMRVWTGPKSAAGDKPREVLERYVAGEFDPIRKRTYTDIKVGVDGLAATEVVYSSYSKLTEETRNQTAVAFATPQGPVLLSLGGWDTEEHKDMLPALELAKKSLKVSAGD